MKTDADLFRIFFAEPTSTQGLRAVFQAGVNSVLEIDDMTDDEILEALQCSTTSQPRC